MDILTPGVIATLTPSGLLGLTIFMILTGRLLPSRIVQQIREDREERVAEVKEREETWRAAYQVSELARDKEADFRNTFIEVAKTMNTLLVALKDVDHESH